MLSKPQGLVRPEGLGKLKKKKLPHRVSNPRPSSNFTYNYYCMLYVTSSEHTHGYVHAAPPVKDNYERMNITSA
jgi:hypothetical protein